MIEKKEKNNFITRLIKERFRITFFHDDFKPVFSLRFTLFSLILWLIGYATFIIIVTTFIISITSLKEYIPGYGTTEEKKQIIQLLNRMDSLQSVINRKNTYLKAILKVLKGEKDSVTPPQKKDPVALSDIKLKASEKEILIRKEIEKDLTLNAPSFSSFIENMPDVQFLRPSQGIVINKFNPETRHYGIDIVGRANEPVRCIQKGVIIYSGYSLNDGNFIIISHPNGFTSIYKHLSTNLKSTGSYVTANDMIGTMGNTGTESTSIHLHFELWLYQKPVDPAKYIVF